MKRIDVFNPYGAPVYYCDSLASTMDTARQLAANGEPDGTVIAAGFQECGRGRQGRIWQTEKDQNLMFTVFCRYADLSAMPKAFTIRAGLAAALAAEDFIPELSGCVMVKWPNDLILVSKEKARKIAGILTESSGTSLFLGMGVNVMQKEFPPELAAAGSLLSYFLENFGENKIPEPLASAAGNSCFALLEKILCRLYDEFADLNSLWKKRLDDRLFRKGEPVIFAEGAADSQKLIRGRLTGIGDNGELLLIPDGEEKPHPFINGELLLRC
ncbi:MAG: biotin--[acetyl-CoA-carboxylase] ligase [Treponema sp.]|nr:biotin--[acetyl-CoA-carboxylase] ligase [Treponema sp.]